MILQNLFRIYRRRRILLMCRYASTSCLTIAPSDYTPRQYVVSPQQLTKERLNLRKGIMILHRIKSWSPDRIPQNLSPSTALASTTSGLLKVISTFLPSTLVRLVARLDWGPKAPNAPRFEKMGRFMRAMAELGAGRGS
ncbi:hypothetical protein Pyn_07501 [Prunus yedoensis var. nudiflora]|uniref:Uncharacterized protein n=1 Tax=Prunus yedoensis var. nudiflora TaxID=2094558 RepID=A0A314UJ50_PRUYE|nr:hypothetical protein Pyn_07501 [Prunus yedoensis var. nudiflora]